MTTDIRLIASMATQALLADLVARWQAKSPQRVVVVSVGGVDAARRVQAGEAFDAVVLAASAVDQLLASGRLVAGTRTDIADSGVAVAVRAGAPVPDIGSAEAVRAAVLAAPRVGRSTGPSGVQMAALFERWGITGTDTHVSASRIVTAPPGVPVGALVARGEVDLGFQQLSELMHQPGITVVGPLPPEIQITTTFAAAIASHSTQPEAVRALLRFFESAEVAALKRLHGMVAA